MGNHKEWPYCELVGTNCIAHTLASHVGGDILALLFEFVRNRQDWSELTLRPDNDGFLYRLEGARGVTERSGVGETLTPVEIGGLPIKKMGFGD